MNHPRIARIIVCLAAMVAALPAGRLLACTNCGCCRIDQDGLEELLNQNAAVGDVIITEIMYNPAGTDMQTGPGGFNKEWIEIYNTTDQIINLQGWRIGDSQDNDWANPFPAGTLLGPKQALVVTGDAVTFDAQWGQGINRIEVGSFPVLANSPSPTNETVAIRDALNITIDSVNYDQANGWPRINGTHGASIFALPSGLSATANNIGTNWAPSAWGNYGAVLSRHDGEFNHGSPGYVATEEQAPFTPSPDAVWSMVLLPDTQNYAKASGERGVLTNVTEWIRDNKDAWNIQVVLHEGDIVNNNNTTTPSSGNQNSTQQWQNAQASMHVLNGHVPYIMAAGNHDFGFLNAENRDTQINTYFKPSDNPLVDPAQGGIMKGMMVPGEIQNAYYSFTGPDGRKMLVLSLEWEPRPATVAWANDVAALPEFADHTAVLLTHAYLREDNTRYTSPRVPGDAAGLHLWSGLVRLHENFEMVVNGHFGGDGQGYWPSAGVHGNTVHQLFFNTQFETQGGNGWIQVLEFLEDGTTVRVRTYSPYLNQVRTHPDFAFEFQMKQLVAPGLPGDFNNDGYVNSADYVLWRKGLGTDYTQDDYQTWRANFGASVPQPPPPPPTVLVNYNMSGIPNQPVASVAASEVASGIAATLITRGPGVNATNLTNGFSANGWNKPSPSRENAIATGDYFQFGFSVQPGNIVSLTSLDLALRRSAISAPMNLELQVSLDGFATPGFVISAFNYLGRVSGDPPAEDPLLSDPYYYMHSDLPGRPNLTTSPGDPIPTIDLAAFSLLQDLLAGTSVTFRLYAWGNTDTTETNTLALGRILGPKLMGIIVSAGSGSALDNSNDAGAHVPEPSCLVLVVLVACFTLMARRSRSGAC